MTPLITSSFKLKTIFSLYGDDDYDEEDGNDDDDYDYDEEDGIGGGDACLEEKKTTKLLTGMQKARPHS